MLGKWLSAGALILAGAVGPATAEDTIGKGPVLVARAPIEQSASSVGQVEFLEKAEHQTKLLSITGGDPAINGVYLFMVVDPESMVEEVASFQIGDFNSWEIAEQAKDHVTLKISRSWVDDASGEIKSTEEKWSVPMVAPNAKELKITIVP